MATAEDIAADAARLEEVERRKLELQPGDPELEQMAKESEDIVERIVPKAAAQKQLTERLTRPPA